MRKSGIVNIYDNFGQIDGNVGGETRHDKVASVMVVIVTNHLLLSVGSSCSEFVE